MGDQTFSKEHNDAMMKIELRKNELDLKRQEAEFEGMMEEIALLRNQQKLDQFTSQQESIRRNIEVLLSVKRTSGPAIHSNLVNDRLEVMIRALDVPK